MKLFFSVVLLLVGMSSGFAQLDVYDTYMSMPQEKFHFMECLINDTPTKRRMLIDYKPNKNVLYLEHSCNNSSVDISFLGRSQEYVGVIYEDMVTLQQVLVVYDFIFHNQKEYTFPSPTPIIDILKNDIRLARKLPMNPGQLDIMWGFSQDGNLVRYVTDSNAKRIVLESWELQGAGFVKSR